MKLIDAALNYLNVPFRHRGRSMRGVDCVGLIICAARDIGYTKYKEFPYGREPEKSILEQVLYDHFGDPVDRPPTVGDIVLMKMPGMVEPSHVGIIIDHARGLGLIHAYGNIGKVVIQRLSDKLQKRIVGVYEWPEKY